jgi:hypothetical protein
VYKTGETAAVTKLFFPDALKAYRCIRKTVPTNLKTQIFTGHGGFSAYLNRFRCKESPSCVCDPEKGESVPHILFECPVHESDRFNTEQKIDMRIEEKNLQNIMSSTHVEEFLTYCTNIAQKVVKRNKTK